MSEKIEKRQTLPLVSKTVKISMKLIDPFPYHPFYVFDDNEMLELIESIRDLVDAFREEEIDSVDAERNPDTETPEVEPNEIHTNPDAEVTPDTDNPDAELAEAEADAEADGQDTGEPEQLQDQDADSDQKEAQPENEDHPDTEGDREEPVSDEQEPDLPENDVESEADTAEEPETDSDENGDTDGQKHEEEDSPEADEDEEPEENDALESGDTEEPEAEEPTDKLPDEATEQDTDTTEDPPEQEEVKEQEDADPDVEDDGSDEGDTDRSETGTSDVQEPESDSAMDSEDVKLEDTDISGEDGLPDDFDIEADADIDADTELDFGHSDCVFYDVPDSSDDKDCRQLTKTLLKVYYEEYAACGRKSENIQVLSPMRVETLVSVDQINPELQDLVNALIDEEDKVRVGLHRFRNNDRVMQVANNYDKNIYNGDKGIVKMVSVKLSRVLVDFDGTLVEYTKKKFDQLKLSFAITVHKVQGGQHPIVIIPITNYHSVLLTRNLLYTAMTRAKQKLIFVGDRDALEYAIRNTQGLKRNTALCDRLKKSIQKAA